MENEQACQILKALADGVDPFTGERFPSGSPYQQKKKSPIRGSGSS